MDNELKPCPFCDGQVHPHEAGRMVGVAAKCEKCKMVFVGFWSDSNRAFAEKFNTRPTPAQTPQEAQSFTCVHLTTEMAQNCPTCNPSLQAPITVTPAPDNEVDIVGEFMAEIEKAALESDWVPEHYTLNEVVSDACSFLRSQPAPGTRDDALREALDTADAVKDAVVDMLPFTDEPPLRSQCLTLADAISGFEKARAALTAYRKARGEK